MKGDTSVLLGAKGLKESLLGINSSIPPLLGPGVGLVTGLEERAELFSSYFDGKQNITLLLACHIRPSSCSIAFHSREVKSLLLDLDSYGGCDPQGFFPLFFKKIAVKPAPGLSVVLRGLVSRECFPETLRQADVVPKPKGPMSCFIWNTDQFPLRRFCPRYFRGSWPSAYKGIWNLRDSFLHASLHMPGHL